MKVYETVVEDSGSKAIASSAELDLCICCVNEMVMEFSKTCSENEVYIGYYPI